MRFSFAPYILHFKEPGGTSRGVMTEKPTFLVKVYDEKEPAHFGIGEAAVFPGLSPEADGNYVWKLTEVMANVALGRSTDLSRHSSIQFGLEQALLDYSNGCKGIWFPSEFSQGRSEIEINGLIWMGDFDRMRQRISDKVKQGFKCLKLKVGAIEWRKELEMVEIIHRDYSPEDLTIRVDANGGFTMDNVLPRLKALADMGVHSIEQPIKPGNPELMSFLCKISPLSIALDEELIGKGTAKEKEEVLDIIRPRYLILKPALCGGFSGAQEWISLARERGTGWWVTSALESNVGLSAISQWVGMMNVQLPQGLGTGGVFSDNFVTPIYLDGDKLKYDCGMSFDYTQFDELKWHY